MRSTPPQGWNSWDCFGSSVTEAEVLANAEFIAEHLLEFGWDTVVVDIDWSDPTASAHEYNAGAPLEMDEYGRLVPAPNRFPSAADGAGFGPLAERIHALGLKFGIHTMRGVPRNAVAQNTPVLGTSATAAEIAAPENSCQWNPDMVGLDWSIPAAQAYYDSTLALYAQWGVDFIKCDDMLWPYQSADIAAYATAIAKTGREIELSLSPGRELSFAHLDHLRANATMWRISDDLWDRWEDVEANFLRFSRWAPHASADGWPDGDMLPLGRIGIRAHDGVERDSRLTHAEQVTLMTLWVIARSPLMIGGHLPESKPETIALFTNREVLEVLRSSGNRELVREGNVVIWGADGEADVRYAAVFNLSDGEVELSVDPQEAGLPGVLTGELRELWTGEVLAPRLVTSHPDGDRGVLPGNTAIDLVLPPHGSALLRYRP